MLAKRGWRGRDAKIDNHNYLTPPRAPPRPARSDEFSRRAPPAAPRAAVLIVPEGEPVSVDKNSVSRDDPQLQGHLTETVEQKTEAGVKGALDATLSTSGAKAAISSEASANASMMKSKKIEISAEVRFIFSTQSKTEEGHYRWIVMPRTGNKLDGRPWSAQSEPRLKLVDARRDRSRGIPPTVRVEVRSRREDLLIEQLEIKDEGLWEAAKRRLGFRNRMAAAESYIRDRLTEEGLEVRNIDDIFGHVTLGAAIAEAV